MGLVKFGKQWEITTREDYENALKVLDGNAFCAMMSDDYRRQKEEEAEIARQKAEIERQATEKGII